MWVQLPPESTVTEPEVVEGLVCDTSVSEFNSRQSPQIAGVAKWLATSLVVHFPQGKPGYGLRCRGFSEGDAKSYGQATPTRTIPLLSAKTYV